ncbi:MAG: phosphate ABC transporter permease subunit PstC, partial [Nocardioidaceae bacterium]
NRRHLGDSLFAGTATGAGVLILAVLAGVAGFLVLDSLPAITAGNIATDAGQSNVWSYVWPLLFGTVLSSAIALLIATPLAIGVALFVSHYAPRRLSAPIAYVLDLLAAVPSVVYGLWGIFFVAPHVVPAYTWLASHLSWVPLFAGPASVTGRTVLTASIVLAVMILPIITALSREIFLQTPRLHEEAALALGATRWEMIRMTVLPYGRSGIVSAAMLGLGRALGETMAVALVLSVSGVVSLNMISNTNPSTIAANIALKFPESSGVLTNLLIASGLALFVLTFAVNFVARAIVGRRADFSGAN